MYQLCVEDVSADKFVPFLWAFVHADDQEFGIPGSLASRNTKLYIILITSPKRQWWKRLEKCTDDFVIVMNPWTLEEMRQA